MSAADVGAAVSFVHGAIAGPENLVVVGIAGGLWGGLRPIGLGRIWRGSATPSYIFRF